MKLKKLQLDQLDRKISILPSETSLGTPTVGWIKSIRETIGMTLQQLADRLKTSRQNVNAMENREAEGSITLKSLRDIANAMDMELVYGFVPKDGTLKNLIERKAMDKARSIVLRTSHSMKLEDQQNSEERITHAMEERAQYILSDNLKKLWD